MNALRAVIITLAAARAARAWNCCDSADGNGDACCAAVSVPAGQGVYFTSDCASGGPWCDAGGYSCCRFCANDCSAYDAMGVDCVLCPGVATPEGVPGSSCCTTDQDCEAKIDAGQEEYLSMFDKSIVCVPDCVGLHCNMFGICQDCRGCYNTCEGAAYYLETHPGTPYSELTFCPDSDVADYQADCLSTPTPAPVVGDYTSAPVSPSCDCEPTDAGKEMLCAMGKSMYCDISACAAGALWCDAWGYENCRFCAFSCEVDDCVLCPAGTPTYSEYCPTSAPTAAPSVAPTYAPSVTYPTYAPTYATTGAPVYSSTSTSSYTGSPTFAPTPAPSMAVTAAPTPAPTVPDMPLTGSPTAAPTSAPVAVFTSAPTPAPVYYPYTPSPTMGMTAVPTSGPSPAPSTAPTSAPTAAPTAAEVTYAPTSAPTAAPTFPMTGAPTAAPSYSEYPTDAPTAAPSAAPTAAPFSPSAAPTAAPTSAPNAFWSYSY